MEGSYHPPKVLAHLQITYFDPEVGKDQTLEWNRDGSVEDDEFPREFMDEYKQIIGDAQGRVSVSRDIGNNDFGTKAGAMVTVSIACNQDQQSLVRAIDLAGSMAKWGAQRWGDDAAKELEQLLEQKKERQQRRS